MKDLDPDKCINQKALIPIARSVMFVEGGLNTNCTIYRICLAHFNIDVRNKLITEI